MEKKFFTLIVLSLLTAFTSLQTVSAQDSSPSPALGAVNEAASSPPNILTVQLNGSVPADSWLAGSNSSPAFVAYGENQATGFNLVTAANPAGYRPVLNTKRSRGTLARPTAVANNDYLASIVSSGYDGGAFQNPATIDFYVDSTPSRGNVPGRISFVTGSNASNRLERLKVGSTGNFNFNGNQMFIQQSTGRIGVGTASPGARLHIKQSVANRAIEWEHATQADNWSVGIGTTTLNCRFEFNGVQRGQISSVDGSFIAGSDLRLKEDIEPLTRLIDKVMQLKPSSYFFKDSRKSASHKSLGFIAQDVEKIFPEMVYDLDEGFKGLNYSAFAVIAIKAIQEQQENIKQQQQSIADQQKIIDNLIERINKLEAAGGTVTGNNTIDFAGVELEQNSPNPFNQTTTFRYKIPDGSVARLNVYDVSGKLVKQMNAPASGRVQLSGNQLAAGTYVYTLLVNGKVATSKKMVLLK